MRPRAVWAPLVVGVLGAICATATAGAEPITKSDAETEAAAVLLQPADVGEGWTVIPPAADDSLESAVIARDIPACKKYAELFVTGTKRGVGEAHQALQDANNNSVIVAPAVFKNVKAAKAYMKTVRKDAYAKCQQPLIEEFIERSLRPTNVTATFTPGPSPDADVPDDVVGTGGTVALTGDFTLDVPYFGYELRSGRTIASVSLPGSLSPEEHERLLTLLSDRMKDI